MTSENLELEALLLISYLYNLGSVWFLLGFLHNWKYRGTMENQERPADLC